MFYQYQVCDLQAFSPLPFHSVDSVFDATQVFNFDEVQLTHFLSCICTSDFVSKKPFAKSSHEDFLLFSCMYVCVCMCFKITFLPALNL